jgi:hypothetical protein
LAVGNWGLKSESAVDDEPHQRDEQDEQDTFDADLIGRGWHVFTIWRRRVRLGFCSLTWAVASTTDEIRDGRAGMELNSTASAREVEPARRKKRGPVSRPGPEDPHLEEKCGSRSRYFIHE